MQLKLRGKSTTQSHRSAIYYVDLTLREGFTIPKAIQEATTRFKARLDAGFDQQALDQAAQAGFNNATFEFSEDEIPELLEEFYPHPDDDDSTTNHSSHSTNPSNINAKTANGVLKQKLGQRLQAQSTSPN